MKTTNQIASMLAGITELTDIEARSMSFILNGEVSAETFIAVARSFPGAYRAQDGVIVRPTTDTDRAAREVIGAEANAHRVAATYGAVVAARLRRFARGDYKIPSWAVYQPRVRAAA